MDGIRFADANTGYAWGQSSLWMTTDAGRTWALQARDATSALEVAHGMAVRVVTEETTCPPGCTYQVEAAPVGSTGWHIVHTPALSGDAVAIALEGPRIYIAVFGNPAGGASEAHPTFIRSADAGGHWTAFDDPCGKTPSGSEADASAVGAAPGGHFVVSFEPRTTSSTENPFVVTSADAAVTFGPHHPISAAFSSVGPGPIAAATGQRLAVAVTTFTATENSKVLISDDGGIHWHETLSVVLLPSTRGVTYLGFQDPSTGRAVLDGRTINTTTDGGEHWTPLTFP